MRHVLFFFMRDQAFFGDGATVKVQGRHILTYLMKFGLA